MFEQASHEFLSQVLLDLGFVEHTLPESQLVYRHEPSDTLIMLASHPRGQRARSIDVKYVRRVLDERGLLNREEFDRRIAEAYSSHTA